MFALDESISVTPTRSKNLNNSNLKLNLKQGLVQENLSYRPRKRYGHTMSQINVVKDLLKPEFNPSPIRDTDRSSSNRRYAFSPNKVTATTKPHDVGLET